MKSRLGNQGVANIIPDSDSNVEGVIYETTDASIKKLDRYEGYPDHYRREEITLETLPDGKSRRLYTLRILTSYRWA